MFNMMSNDNFYEISPFNSHFIDNLVTLSEIKKNHLDSKSRIDWIYVKKYLKFDLESYLRLPEDTRHCYQSKNCLGSGSYGVVFQCKLANGEKIAVKISSDLQDETDFGSCVFELMCSIREDSPYLVRYLDGHIDKQNWRVYVAMEYYDGGNLDNFIRNRGKVKEQQIKLFFYQLLQGINDLNKNGFMHRDLKPGNIFITKTGELKIGDFGLGGYNQSHCYKNGEYRTVVSRWWRAPEVELKCPYNLSIDVFSIACIIVDILTQRPLLYGESDGINHLYNTLRILGKMTPECIKYFDDEIAKQNAQCSINNSDVIYRQKIWNEIKIFNNSPELAFAKIHSILRSTCISKELRDILLKCFTYCPNTRPTASDVLSYQYFHELKNVSDISNNTSYEVTSPRSSMLSSIYLSSSTSSLNSELNQKYTTCSSSMMELVPIESPMSCSNTAAIIISPKSPICENKVEILDLIRNMVTDFEYTEATTFLSFYLYKRYVKEISIDDEDNLKIAVVLTYLVSTYTTEHDVGAAELKRYLTRKGAKMSATVFRTLLSDSLTNITMKDLMFQNPYSSLINRLSEESKSVLYHILENDKLNLTLVEMIEASLIIGFFGSQISLIINSYI